MNVLVVHESDTTWVDVLHRLEKIFSEGLIGTFVVLPVSTDRPALLDPLVKVLRAGECHVAEWIESTLLGHLATLGEIGHIKVTGLNMVPSAASEAATVATSLNNEIERVRALLVKFATSVARSEVRCSVVAEDEKASGAPFLSPLADVNIVVIPRDVSATQAVARPITRDNRDLFAVHAALEICSLLGLWESMGESPIDGLRARQLGRRGYELRLFRSRIKGLLTPPLPIADLVDDSGDLPVPSGFSTVDNLAVIVDRYASVAYPANLVFEPVEKGSESKTTFWKRLVLPYLQEFGRTFRSIPSMIRNGFQGELDVVAAHALDRMLGGAEARIRPIIPSEDGGDNILLSAESVEELIRDIEFREDRPLIEAIPPEQWERLVSTVLGVADGNPSVDRTRETVMPSGFLLRDKAFLAPNIDSVANHVRSVMPLQPRITEPSVVEPTEEEVPGDTFEADPDGEDTTFSPPITFVAPGEVDLMALREAVRRSGMSRPEPIQVVQGDSSDIEFDALAVEVERADQTLVGRITARFDTEFRKAEDSVLESLSELRSLPSKFGSTDGGSVSRSVFFTIAAALGVIIISLSTHDPLRSFMSFEWTSTRNRDFVWVAMSSIVVVLSLATMPSALRRNWQSRAMTTAATCAGILAVEYVTFDPIRNRVIGLAWGATTALVALLILVATSVLCLISIRRNAKSEDPIRRRLSRFLALVLWVYLVVGASAFVAGPESFVVDWQDSTRHKLLLATQFMGWICLLMASIVIVIVRVRQANSLGTLQVTFDWAQDNLVHAIDQRRVLRAAYTQWLVTSAVLSRIIWHPLGRETTDQIPFEGTMTGDESVLKFDLAGIELSDQGRVALLAKLKQMFVQPGWLQVQFNHARDAYTSNVSFITGDPEDQHDPVVCPSVPPVENLLAGDARGDRFAFAQQVMEGAFDARLLSSATQGNLDAVYANILNDDRMHVVSQAQNEFSTGSQFLRDIVPIERTKIPPRMLSSLNVPGDPLLLMDVDLWWPETALVGTPDLDFVETHVSKVLRLEKLDDSVVMVAVLTELSQPLFNGDVLGVEDFGSDRGEPV